MRGWLKGATLACLVAASVGIAGFVGIGQAAPARMKGTDDLQSRAGPAIDPETHPGRQLFATNCLSCHAGGVPKAPAVIWLEMMSPDMILGAMRGGIMTQQAAHLTADQQQQIAEYLTRTRLADYRPPAPPRQCTGRVARFTGAPPARVSWGHDNRRFVPEAVGGLTAADVPGLKLKWAFAYPGAVRARSQPALGWNSIFVGSHDGTVYALDIDSGCARWTFRASAEVRTAIVVDPDSRRLYFGDVLGRTYALDAMTGRELWRVKVEDHANATITGSPTLGGGRLYVPVSSLEVTSAVDPAYACCTFRGAVVALDPATGAVLWKTYSIPAPPAPHGRTAAGTEILGPSGAPVWTTPTYDASRDRVYFGTGENYSSPADQNSDALFALNAATGHILWRTQFTSGDAWNAACMVGNDNCPEENGPDYDLAASPLLVALGGNRDILVVGQKSGMAYGVEPANGRVVWQQRLGHGGTQGGVHFGMSAEGGTIYVPIVDMVNTYDGRDYDARLNGAGIHALDAATGAILWRHRNANVCGERPFCDPGVSAATTAIPGAVIAGHLDGWLRIYDRADGRLLWSHDTTTPVRTVSGQMASGGSMSGPGAAVHEGRLVVNSGYGLYYHMPGNVLLVFGK